MCVYDGESGRQVYRKVGVEADRVYVEQRDECGACVMGEFGKNFRADRCGCDDKRVWSEGIRLCEP